MIYFKNKNFQNLKINFTFSREMHSIIIFLFWKILKKIWLLAASDGLFQKIKI